MPRSHPTSEERRAAKSPRSRKPIRLARRKPNVLSRSGLKPGPQPARKAVLRRLAKRRQRHCGRVAQKAEPDRRNGERRRVFNQCIHRPLRRMTPRRFYANHRSSPLIDGGLTSTGASPPCASRGLHAGHANVPSPRGGEFDDIWPRGVEIWLPQFVSASAGASRVRCFRRSHAAYGGNPAPNRAGGK